jgi:hypothetical protein
MPTIDTTSAMMPAKRGAKARLRAARLANVGEPFTGVTLPPGRLWLPEPRA